MIYLLRVPTNVVVGTTLFQTVFVVGADDGAARRSRTTTSTWCSAHAAHRHAGVIGAQYGAVGGRSSQRRAIARSCSPRSCCCVCFRIGWDLVVTPRELYSIAQLLGGRGGTSGIHACRPPRRSWRVLLRFSRSWRACIRPAFRLETRRAEPEVRAEATRKCSASANRQASLPGEGVQPSAPSQECSRSRSACAWPREKALRPMCRRDGDRRVTSGFNGTEIIVFGSVDHSRQPSAEAGYYDVVVVVEGASAPLLARRKSNVAGLWINTVLRARSRACRAITPSRSTRADRGNRRRRRARAQRHRPRLRACWRPRSARRPSISSQDLKSYKDAVVRLKQKRASISNRTMRWPSSGRGLFRCTIALPPNVSRRTADCARLPVPRRRATQHVLDRVRLEREGIELWLYRVRRSDHSVALRHRRGRAGGGGGIPGVDACSGVAVRVAPKHSVFPEEAGRDRIKAFLAQHPHRDALVAEQRRKASSSTFETAREGAEGRQHEAAYHCRQSKGGGWRGPWNGTSRRGEGGRRSRASTGLPAGSWRKVRPETSRRSRRLPRNVLRNGRVVIAGEPGPLAVVLQDGQDVALLVAHAASAASTSWKLSPRQMTVWARIPVQRARPGVQAWRAYRKAAA